MENPKEMTLRDYFAGIALQGMLANSKLKSTYLTGKFDSGKDNKE